MKRFDDEALRRIRADHQRLSDAGRSPTAAEVVRAGCALQAQEWPSAQLALLARGRGLTAPQLKHAREVERSLVLTWGLRGTLHLMAAEDVCWLVALSGPGATRATHRRYQQLGLTEAVRERALDEMAAILAAEGPLRRAALADELGKRGIPVAGQAIHHLVRFGALRGLLCLGPEVDGDLTYVLLNDWLPANTPSRSPADPAAGLARRYLRAFAPARAADFARWSGLGKRDVTAAWAAIAPECERVMTPYGEALMLRAQLDSTANASAAPTVRLLPRYDNMLLGYESRAFMLAEAHAKRVHPGGGLIRSCVTVDGVAQANWRLRKLRRGLRVEVAPFETLPPQTLPALQAEVEALGRFFDASAELKIERA